MTRIKKTHRFLALTIAVPAIMLFIAGCGGGGSSERSTAKSSDGRVAAAISFNRSAPSIIPQNILSHTDATAAETARLYQDCGDLFEWISDAVASTSTTHFEVYLYVHNSPLALNNPLFDNKTLSRVGPAASACADANQAATRDASGRTTGEFTINNVPVGANRLLEAWAFLGGSQGVYVAAVVPRISDGKYTEGVVVSPDTTLAAAAAIGLAAKYGVALGSLTDAQIAAVNSTVKTLFPNGFSYGTSVTPVGFTKSVTFADYTGFTDASIIAAGTSTWVDYIVSLVSNRAPFANAGPDQSISRGAVATLTASASSDPDGDAVTYAWTQTSGPSVTLSNPTGQTATFTASAYGTYVFQLVVSDGKVSSVADTVSVVVANRQPTANAGADQAVSPGGLVSLTGSGSDPDGDTLTYQWTQTSGPTVTLSGSTTAAPSFTPTAAGTYVFQLVVSDGAQSSVADTVSVVVANRPPTANAGVAQTASAGSLVTLNGSGADPDGDTLTYLWTQTSGTGVTLSGATTASPSFTPTAAGSYVFQLVVNDGTVGSSPSSVAITVTAIPPSVNGTITSGGSPVAGAVVALYNDAYSASTQSAADGSYSFFSVPAGAYFIIATKDGFTLESKTVVVP